MHPSIRTAAMAVAAIALITGATSTQQPAVKIAYVDGSVLMNYAPGKAEAESLLAKDAAGFDAELQKLGTEIDSLMRDYQKSEATLTAAQKDTRQKLIAGKQQAATDRNTQLQQKMAARRDELGAPLREVIKKVLDDIRTEEGYTMIVDGSAVLAADKNLDITDRVVARLKTIAAKKGPVNQPAGLTKKPPTSPSE